MFVQQMRFQAPIDQRTDIYAVGCVAYWLLTGLRVFEAANRGDMLVMHAHQKPLLPSTRIKEPLDARLEALVMECLAKNPDRRPKSARDLSERLAGLGLAAAWSSERRAEWWADATRLTL